MLPELAHVYVVCPACSGPDLEIVGGRGVTLVAVNRPGPACGDPPRGRQPRSRAADYQLGQDQHLQRRAPQALGRFVESVGTSSRAVLFAGIDETHNANCLSPPVSPMLIVDRDGNVPGLPFGSVKSAEGPQGVLEPLLGTWPACEPAVGHRR